MADVPAYASSATSGHIRKSERLADILAQMGKQDPNVYNTAMGTNLTALANVIGNYRRNQHEKKGEEGLKTERTALADKILAGVPGSADITKTQLEGDKPFDLTPQGTARRTQEGQLGDQARAIADLVGDPTAALNYAQGQKRQMVEDDRYTTEQGYKREVDDRNYMFESTDALRDDERAAAADAETARHHKAMEAATLAAAQAKGTDNFGDENSLRGQYNSVLGDFRVVRDAYARIKSIDPGKPAGQMALVFGVMKMLDPTSSVREGEYANARNTTGAAGQIANIYNQIKDGKFLSPEQVEDFKAQAENLYSAADKDAGRTYDHYSGIVAARGFSPNAIEDYRLPKDEEEDPRAIAVDEAKFNEFVKTMPPSITNFMSKTIARSAMAGPRGAPAPAAAAAPAAPAAAAGPPQGWSPEDWAALEPQEQQRLLAIRSSRQQR